MKYMLLIYGDEQASDEAEKARCYQESAHIVHQIRAARAWGPWKFGR